MASWLVPALKAVLPHLGSLISVAKPHFTPKEAAPDQSAVVQAQISELQAAASQTAAHVQELALQLQRTVTALEQAAAMAERRLRAAFFLSIVGLAMSSLALLLAVFLAYAR
jgi:hypothetical protein